MLKYILQLYLRRDLQEDFIVSILRGEEGSSENFNRPKKRARRFAYHSRPFLVDMGIGYVFFMVMIPEGFPLLDV